MASDCIDTEILPKILKAKQDFYVTTATITPTKGASDVYGNARIPYRAVGQTIVGIYDVTSDDPIDPLTYWFENNKIYFEDGYDASYRVRYYLRPNRLVETTDACRITAIGVDGLGVRTGVVTVSAVPSDITTGVVVDFIRAKPGTDTLGFDVTAGTVQAATAPYTITFSASDLPSELAVGDYVCTYEETPIPQIPPEWVNYLAYWVAHNILESLGDVDAADAIAKKIPRMESNAFSLISPRSEAKHKAIVKKRYEYYNRRW